MLQFALAENFTPAIAADDGLAWLEAMPARVYHTPMYGEVPMPVDKLQRMVDGFKAGVRGQEIATNFDHGEDKAKGNQASGWFKDFKVAPSAADPTQMSLYAAVEFTEDAKKEIKDGKWKYFSLEWDDAWLDNAGNTHKDVIIGGAVTNRPVAKNMATLPINFSEAQWNELDDETKQRVEKHNEEVKAAQELLKSNGFTVTNESKEWEHSEPGTGPAPAIGSPEQPDPGTGQPVPRIAGDPAAEDDAIGGGWRREPLPRDSKLNERDPGGSVVNEEELAALRKALGLKEDASVELITTTASTVFSETAALKQAVNAATEEKQFAEKYPTVWAEHQAMRERDNDNTATKFSESVAQITVTEGEAQKSTGKGLSALALEQVQSVHKKFAEGSVTLADFESVIKTITQGGIVDFSEHGSNKSVDLVQIDTATPHGLHEARKLFAEKIAEIKVKDELDDSAAFDMAVTRFPELAAAYRVTLPA